MAKCCMNVLEEFMRCCKARRLRGHTKRPELERNGSLSTGGREKKKTERKWERTADDNTVHPLKQFTLDDQPRDARLCPVVST